MSGHDHAQRIPVLRVGRTLLISVQTELHDQLALRMQDELASQIVLHRATGVVIDISAVDIIDSFMGRILSDIASMSRLLGAQTIVAGMQPAVAITLVELGLSLKGVTTTLDMDRGLEILNRRSAGQEHADVGHDG